MKYLVSLITVILIMYGCASAPKEKEETKLPSDIPDFLLYEIPKDLETEEARAKTIERYRPYLEGVKFFIDPGHGGEDHYGHSPDGKVVEAIINLRVALALKGFLEEAGATVFMSRRTDETVDLGYRSELANNSGADMFISIHHNAPGGEGNYWTNFTSTYYHATPEFYEYEPCNREIARYVQRDMAYAMRNSGGLGSFDGTYSDYLIYPGDGFSVLRKTELPAILVEASFFTNRMEIIRLQREEFNRIQAWGIFRGLGKYFANGVPKITYLQARSGIQEGSLNLFFSLEDDKGIDPESIITFIDSVQTSYNYLENDGLLSLNIENPEPGELMVRILCANKNGNHAFPYHRKIVIQ